MRFAAALLALLIFQEDAVELRFQYKPGDSESTVMACDLDMEVGVNMGGETHTQKMTGPIKLTLNLDCPKGKAQDGGKLTAMTASYSDIETTQKVSTNGGTFELSVKGKNVVMKTEDGETLVDTENGVNPEAGENILKEMEFGEKAEFQLDPRGLVKGKGIEKVRELLGGMAGDNLFPLVLPEKAAGTGSTWKHPVTLEKLGKMKLGKPVEVPMNFKLEKFEGEGDRRVAVISLLNEATLKNIECEGEMEGAGKAKMLIRKLTVSMTGETRFNVAKGRIAKSTVTAKVAGDVEVTPETIKESFDVDVKVNIKASMAPK